MAEDDLAVGLVAASGGGEGRAVIVLVALLRAVHRWILDPFEAGRAGCKGIVEGFEFHPHIEGDDIDEIDGPTVVSRAGRGRAVGDALHLVEDFTLELAEEQGIHERAQVLPGCGGCFRAVLEGERANVGCDLRRQEMTVLHAARVGFALDVQDGPARLRIAVAGALPLDGGGRGSGVRGFRPGWAERERECEQEDASGCDPVRAHGRSSFRAGMIDSFGCGEHSYLKTSSG